MSTRTALLLALGAVACAPRSTRSPEALRHALVASLASDDPRAAYEMLAPEVQAKIDYKAFAARWREDANLRRKTAAAAKALPDAERVSSREATTVHPGGIVLRWTRSGRTWRVIDGLPGTRHASTPAAAVRGFLAAVAGTNWGAAQRYLSDGLADTMREDWSERVDAIEAALARPGAIEVSDDGRRAQLRYEPGRRITLEQSPAGWRITDSE